MIGCEIFSTEGIVDSVKFFWTFCPLPFQIPHLLRQGYKRLQWSSPLNNSDQHHDDGDDKQDMNVPANRVATDQSRQPQNLHAGWGNAPALSHNSAAMATNQLPHARQLCATLR